MMVKATLLLASLVICCVSPLVAQSTLSIGVFSGVTSSFTLDQGVSNDPRYSPKYDLKLAPFGISYGVDYSGHGFVVSPGIMSVGRNYHFVDALGRNSGTRTTSLTYFNLPIAYKKHLIDKSSVKASFLIGFSLAYLTKVKEVINHESGTYNFPQEVYPNLPYNYVIESNGVKAPELRDNELSRKEEYKLGQVFGFVGLRTDWDFMANWRFSVDVRANYGVLETRTKEYLDRIERHQSIYDTPGSRHDLFALVTFGISRVIDKNSGDPRYNSKKISSPKSKPGSKKSPPKKKKRRR
jgi:hypothetical protein